MLLKELVGDTTYECVSIPDDTLSKITFDHSNSDDIYTICLVKLNKLLKFGDTDLSWCGCVNVFKAIESNNPVYLYLYPPKEANGKFSLEQTRNIVQIMYYASLAKRT